MNFIHHEQLTTQLMEGAGKLKEVMCLKKWAVDGDVERLIAGRILLFDALQQHGGFSGAPCAKYADTAFIPVNMLIEIALAYAYPVDEPQLFAE